MALPNFIIIGAAKSGTTALYEYFRQHPQVFMSPLKETNFFAFDGKRPDFGGPRGEMLNRNIVCKYEDFKALFDGVTDEIAIGEASPRYMLHRGTADRIKKRIPHARLIAILRNPVEQAFSSFSMTKRDGFEPCETLAEAIADEPRRIRERWAFGIYVQRGYCAQQLLEYYQVFNDNQIRVYLYDDFAENPLRVLQDMFRFIGADDSFVPDMSKRHNISGEIKNPVLRVLWTKTHPIRSILPTMPKTLRQRVSRFFTSRELVRLQLPEETRRQLFELYRADILRLQDLINRDLSLWLQ